MPAYLDGDNFVLEVVFKGRQIVTTKAGNIRAFKLVPKMERHRGERGD